jgi:hypothetical protein
MKSGEVVVLVVCVGRKEGYNGRATFVGQERGIYGGQARLSPAPRLRAENVYPQANSVLWKGTNLASDYSYWRCIPYKSLVGIKA